MIHSIKKQFFYIMSFVTFTFMYFLSGCGESAENLNKHQADIVHSSEFSEILETLCQSNTVLLGEGPTHGEGTTLTFKADIVKSLITDCGFELLLFEASFYEFIKLHKIKESGEEINRDEIETALGYIYRNKAELQDLFDFISNQISSDSLKVGGLDYQPGGRGQDYSNFEMLDEILPSLMTEGREQCKVALKQLIYYNFPKEAPYNIQQKEKLLNCLERPNPVSSSHQINMIRKNLYTFIDRDFLSGRERMAARSSFMYENFKFWIELFDSPPKTIVWSSSTHAAKSSEISPAFDDIPNFGSLVKENFGKESYSLGFSALQGSVSSMVGDKVDLPTAPEDSIEFASFLTVEGDIAFLDASDLRSLGIRQGAASFNKYQEQDWSTIFDGVVVFRQQEPALTR